MSVGDVTITATNLAAAASIQVQVQTRCRVITSSDTSGAYVKGSISSDGTTYYKVLQSGQLSTGISGASSIGNCGVYIPASYYVQVTNEDTAAHDVAIFVIEY